MRLILVQQRIGFSMDHLHTKEMHMLYSSKWYCGSFSAACISKRCELHTVHWQQADTQCRPCTYNTYSTTTHPMAHEHKNGTSQVHSCCCLEALQDLLLPDMHQHQHLLGNVVTASTCTLAAAHSRKDTWCPGCCLTQRAWPMAACCLHSRVGSHCSQC
jgi:hypothetical protein